MLYFLQDKKGQAGSVFKLLIGAVIGIAIIAIIVVIIQIASDQKTYLSEEVFANKITMAMKNPTGSEYIVDNLTFSPQKVINKKALSEETGLGENCISLEIAESAQSYIETDPNKNYILFTKMATVNVGVTCNLSTDDVCDLKCNLKVYGKGN